MEGSNCSGSGCGVSREVEGGLTPIGTIYEMGLKERVEQAKRNAQVRHRADEMAFAQSRAQMDAHYHSVEAAKRRIWDEAQGRFQDALNEHRQELVYIRQVVDQAASQISPVFRRFEEGLRGKHPYVDAKAGLIVWGPKLVESSGQPVIGTAAHDDEGVRNFEWKGTVSWYESRLAWGRYPFTEYYKGIFHRERWTKADYCLVEVSLKLSASDLENFGDIRVNDGGVTFAEWQADPAKVSRIVGEALSRPKIYRYDERAHDAPYQSSHMPSDGSF